MPVVAINLLTRKLDLIICLEKPYLILEGEEESGWKR